MTQIRMISLAGCVVISALSCNKKGGDESSVKWGQLDEAESGFVSLAPGSSITTCGFEAELVAENVRKWARAIGRDGNLKIDSNCTSGATRRIRINSPEESARTDVCASNSQVAGYTDGRDIWVCQRFNERVETHVLLHEVGHLWGLCDQYGDAGNCDKAHSSRQDPGSVMGAARGLTQLTADDVAGLKAIAARTDVPNHSAWERLGSGGGDTGNTGGGNSGNTGGGTQNPPPPPPAGDCSCSIDASGVWCAVWKGNEPKAWMQASDRSCSSECSGALAASLRECGGSAGTSGSPSTGSGSTDTGNAGLCRAAGGSFQANASDGFGLCDCGTLLYREDAMGLYTRDEFIAACKAHLN